MLILGLNMFHADASAAIIVDGEVAFAIAEERLNRRKHFGGFPALAVKACVDSYWTEMCRPELVELLLRAGASPRGAPFPCGREDIDAVLARYRSI